MRLSFTKMQGAGNDFIMINAWEKPFHATPALVRALCDRHFGIGCDQLLVVEKPETEQADFKYRIFNCDGGEVEMCGNGARCFAVYVRHLGLTDKTEIACETMKGIIRPRVETDGRVTVDMGEPVFGPEAVHFKSEGHSHLSRDKDTLWQVKTPEGDVWLSLVSMGNPHAVMVCGDTETACVETIGAALQKDADFTQKVNVGFLEALSRSEARLRVYERGAGETLACGTGACAAAVAGMRRGMFDEVVEITMHGGKLRISWAGPGHHVYLTGPAEVVFEGSVETDNLPVMPA